MGREKPANCWAIKRPGIYFILTAMIFIGFVLSSCKKETPAPQSSPPIPPAPAATSPQVPAGPVPAQPASVPEKTAPAKAPEYSYNPGGRPDPFAPLVVPGADEGKGKKGLKALQVSELKLTGIVWDKRQYVALVEAPDGLGYVLKVNDLIGNAARVARISSNSVMFEVKEQPYLPQSRVREVELKLKKEE